MIWNGPDTHTEELGCCLYSDVSPPPGWLLAQQPDRDRGLYLADADSAAQIETSTQFAKKSHKQVLLIFGANWCGWCHKLAAEFDSNSEIAKLLKKKYLVVRIDIGKFDNNRKLVGQYGVKLQEHGIPYLIVLDSAGRVVATQPSTPLEEGPAYSKSRLHDFLVRSASGRQPTQPSAVPAAHVPSVPEIQHP